MVLGWAERVDCRKFVTAQDIVDVRICLKYIFFIKFF